MTLGTPEKLDELTPHQLLAEIHQIVGQYTTEVPGTRRNWPKSLRARILALEKLGIPKKRIADLSGIPAATVFLWCRQLPRTVRSGSGQFIELKSNSNPTVGIVPVSPTVGLELTGTQSAPADPLTTGLILHAPGGFSFGGFGSVDDCVRLYRELSR